MKKLFPSCALALVSLASSCGGTASLDNLSPHESVLASVNALRQNDMTTLVHSLVTGEQLATLEREWDEKRSETPEATEEASFRESMERFTAAGAEQAIMAELEPKLDEMRPQVAMMIGMFGGMGQAVVAGNEALSDEEKEDAGVLLQSIGEVLLENDITAVDSARQAVGILCKTARGLELASMADVQALEFEELLSKGDAVLSTVKDVLEVYNLSLDSWLETFTAETVSQEGDRATVRVSYEILGVSNSSEYQMVRVGTRWVREEATELELEPRP
jgi:hypothetical protein